MAVGRDSFAVSFVLNVFGTLYYYIKTYIFIYKIFGILRRQRSKNRRGGGETVVGLAFGVQRGTGGEEEMG